MVAFVSSIKAKVFALNLHSLGPAQQNKGKRILPYGVSFFLSQQTKESEL